MRSVFLTFLKQASKFCSAALVMNGWVSVPCQTWMSGLYLAWEGERMAACMSKPVLSFGARAGSCSWPGNLLSSQVMHELMCVWTGVGALLGWRTAGGVLDKQERCPDRVQTLCMLLCSASPITEWACSKWWFPHHYSNSHDQIMLLGNAGLCSDSAQNGAHFFCSGWKWPGSENGNGGVPWTQITAHFPPKLDFQLVLSDRHGLCLFEGTKTVEVFACTWKLLSELSSS